MEPLLLGLGITRTVGTLTERIKNIKLCHWCCCLRFASVAQRAWLTLSLEFCSERDKPMRFTPEFLDELRARLPVSEVVGKRVKLKKAGREWRGLSPFQQEKTPSFFANDQKGFYHDFSSGKHGDIISFLMETEGVGFAEAVERLASIAGV